MTETLERFQIGSWMGFAYRFDGSNEDDIIQVFSHLGSFNKVKVGQLYFVGPHGKVAFILYPMDYFIQMGSEAFPLSTPEFDRFLGPFVQGNSNLAPVQVIDPVPFQSSPQTSSEPEPIPETKAERMARIMKEVAGGR